MFELSTEYRSKAFARPNDEVINWMVEHSPIVEMGAGTGYWAHLLTEAGAVVTAYDVAPIALGGNKYTQMTEDYGNVLIGEPPILATYGDRTLFLCWPPYDDPMAYNCLMFYSGDKLIYIGEGWGGCTGCDHFWEELNDNWTEEECPVDIESSVGLRDNVYFFRRKHV